MTAIIEISKSSVLDEVYKQTAYIGKNKSLDGKIAYYSMAATGDNATMLERFWKEATAFTTGNLKQHIADISITTRADETGREINPIPALADPTEVLKITLTMPKTYSGNQTKSINSSLYSYFVNYITSRWMAITSKEEAVYYEKYANISMEDVVNKLFNKQAPIRPT